MIVWDKNYSPPVTDQEVWCWQSYTQNGEIFSVPRYLEDHAERLRLKYLAFIHELGEAQIGGRPIVEHLTAEDGFSMWWMSQLAEKSPFKSPRIYDCLRLLALEEILAQQKPSHLTLESANNALSLAVKQLCKSQGIAFSWKKAVLTRGNWTIRGGLARLPYVVQGLLKFLHYFIKRWPLRQLNHPQWYAGDDAVFFCSYFIHLDSAACMRGGFYSRQWEVLPSLLNETGRRTNWLQHFLVSKAVPGTEAGMELIQRFNRNSYTQGNHAFLDTYLTWSVIWRAMRTWLWLNVIRCRLRNASAAFHPKESKVWLWPLLKDDWGASMSGTVAVSNCLWLALFDDALDHLPHQRIGLYLCENQGWEKAFLHAWRKHGHGKIVGVQHATVPFWHLYYFHDVRTLADPANCRVLLPDLMAVNGPMAWDAFLATGFPVSRLIAVEALRYMQCARSAVRADSAPESKPAGVKVLILGDIDPSSMHNLLTLLERATKLLSASYNFTLKPHPGYAVSLMNYPGLKLVETSDALNHILGRFDIVLSANGTSAALDAYLVGMPLIIGLNGGELNLSPLRNQPGVRFTSTPEELTEALQHPVVSKRIDPTNNDFFFIDDKLPRWQRLLSCSLLP